MKGVFAMFRPLLPYGMCAMAAAFLAYLLTRPLDYSTAIELALMATLLIFPLLLRWHYPLLLLSVLLPVNLFFIKGQPILWMVMVPLSLGIVAVERAIKGRSRLVYVPQIVFPLAVLSSVVIITAELTGGMGFHALGSDIFGGKKYALLFSGILIYFALTSRPIPPEKARLYTTLFLLGSLPSFISDLVTIMPGAFQYIYLFIPASGSNIDEMGNYSNLSLGVSRMGGLGTAALAVYFWMLCRHGVRGIFLAQKPWRIFWFFVTFVLIGMGGFRSSIMEALLIFALLFFLERLHHTPLVFVFSLGGLLSMTMMLPFASKLPFVLQRSLAFLPLPLNPEAIASAQASSEWRVQLWTSLLQEVPRHLLLGKGFAIPVETFNEMMASDLANAFQVNASQQSLALAGDYHNGPLSVIIPFGLWGVLAFVWFLAASITVLYRNYKFGEPANLLLNRFLFCLFLVKVVIFLTVFGALQDDIGVFASYIGFSIAINHGACNGHTADQAAKAAGRHIIFAGKRPTRPPQLLPFNS